MLKMCDQLRRCGLTLGTVSAPKETGGFYGRATCIYLRPLLAQDLSLEKLYDIVLQLAGHQGFCNCGACFQCLKNAGCLDC